MMSFGTPGISRGIKTILIATLVVYVFQVIPQTGRLLLNWGSLIPYLTFAQGQFWRLVSYMFLHDPNAPFHILFNLLMLWMFGNEIETIWGTKRFTYFYFICGIGSGFFSLLNLFNARMSLTPVIGASGAVLGVLTMYAYYFPHRQVLLFFILPVNIRIVILGYALLSLFGAFSSGGVISHITHLGGIVVALSYVKLYPLFTGFFENISTMRSERLSRRRAEEEAGRKAFFEREVDPILEKIAREGMESLTKEEKQILKKAAARDKERLKRKKIIPFDPFT